MLFACGHAHTCAWAKRRTGRQLGSRTLVADSAETVLCTWLSAVLLVGLVLNAGFGWWWADPVAALGIVVLAVREGLEAWKGELLDDDNHDSTPAIPPDIQDEGPWSAG